MSIHKNAAYISIARSQIGMKPASRGAIAAVVAHLTLGLAACYSPARHIVYDAQRNRMVKVPPYIGTGDSVYLVVRDSIYGYAYNSKADTFPVVIGDRAALFGALDLTQLTETLRDQVILLADKAVIAVVDSTQSETGVNKIWSAPIRDPSNKAKVDSLRLQFDNLLRERDSLINALPSSCDTALMRATTYFLDHPAEFRALKFLLSDDAKTFAGKLAADSLSNKVRRAISKGFDKPLRARLVDTLHSDASHYARRLAMFAMIGAGSGTPNRDSLSTQLKKLRPCADKVEATRVREIDALARKILEDDVWKTVLLPPRMPTLSPVLAVAGLDVTPLVAPTRSDKGRVRKLYDDLIQIGRNNSEIVMGLNQLPMHAVSVVADTVYIGTYWKPVRLKITPVRSRRFAEYVADLNLNLGRNEETDSTGASSDKPSAEKPTGDKPANPKPVAPKPEGDKPTDVNKPQTMTVGSLTVTVSTAAPAATTESKPSAVAAAAATFPTAEVDVLPRYRFHMGVGLMRSRLRSSTYSTEADTVDGVAGTRVTVTGESPYKNTPIATLGYSILPSEGKVYGAQGYVTSADSASRGILDYIYQAGLGFTFGVGLKDPLDQFFLGAETEPVPGVFFGLGYHFGSVSVSRADSTAFVPKNMGDAIFRQWKQSFAWQVSVDPSVIVSALGKLVGLRP
jgi:hypothetical protein